MRKAQTSPKLITVNRPRLLQESADDFELVENTIATIKETFDRIKVGAKNRDNGQ